ncbi:MAG: NAD(P)-dependent glycerol-3-phosphate dehydrogenase [Oscillospiraceae bacterium]|jgi:glycerol-3-phosphate dehydrogenase (NAD(P)+)|nr:NAD(P)-dependent glycerol-3-phosphate dehydrogenase [Oscillospiraceae bacterium]
MKISVIGSGAWGTALAALLAKNGHAAVLRFLSKPHADVIDSSGASRYLPGVALPERLRLIDSLDGIEDDEIIVIACPSISLRGNAELLRGKIRGDAIIVSASKGIERATGSRLSEVLSAVLGDSGRIAVLSGPSHAEEVARGIPTGCVAAARSGVTARIVQDAFMSSEFRVYTSDDVIGVELSGAVKNIMAIAVGISDGLGYGDNTKAMLMTRGLREISRLGEDMGGRCETFSGLAGVGDLIVTCTSAHSRNRRAGLNIGAGMSVDNAMAEVGAVVEGYYAAEAVFKLAYNRDVETPITNALYGILYDNFDPREATISLMGRDKKSEI